ncbi:MAG: dihydrofolate reductase [Myxococcota bacterium]
MRGMIVALDRSRIMGVNGQLPWHHSADLRRFKRLTSGGTVLMGRKTFESIGRPLPKRRNLVVSRSLGPVDGVEIFADFEKAVEAAAGDLWFIGGRQIYESAMSETDVIDVTWVPDELELRPEDEVVYFPELDPAFEAGPIQNFPEPGGEDLKVQRFARVPKTSQ